MKLTIAHLRAAGMTDSQIVKVVEEAQVEQREKDRIRQRNHRARHASHARHSDKPISEQKQHPRHSDMRDINPPLNNPPLTAQEKPKKVSPSLSARKTKLAADWQLADKDFWYAKSKGWTDTRIAEQADRFRDHALANGRLQLDWAAAWRNWVNSPYQRPGGGRPQSLKDRNREIMDELDRFIDAEAA